jgi:hypothetical protein
VTSQAIWYTANGELYKATLEGTDVKQVPAVFGATKVEAEENGSVFYATEGARYAGIYERLSSGKTTLFAGGPKATIDGTQQESGSLPAMSVGLVPLNFATGSNGDLYIANYEHEQLDLVANGIFRQITSGGGDWHAAQVASGPNGSVYGIGTDVMDRIDASAISSMFVVPQNINVGFFGYAGMAVSPGGSIYVSYYSQDSGESEQSAIVRYSSSGQATVVVFAGHPCYWLNVEKQSARPFQIPPSAISLPKTVGCSPKVSEY